jgi:hypothetical protein
VIAGLHYFSNLEVLGRFVAANSGTAVFTELYGVHVVGVEVNPILPPRKRKVRSNSDG